MRKEIKITYEELDDISKLDKQDKDVLNKAVKAIDNSYAPYSKYNVGAAVLLSNGKIITGNNQENVAYPSGLCAERTALFYASSQHPDKEILTIAVAAKTNSFIIETPVTPCGACRQVMAEYETKQGKNIRILLMSQTGKITVINSVNDILPLMFHADKLKIK